MNSNRLAQVDRRDAPPGALKQRLTRSVFWLVWSRGFFHGASLASAIVVARLLEPSDYGLAALVWVWTSTLALLSELGLGAALIQFQDLDEADINACFWTTLCLAGLGYVGLWAATPAIAGWFASPRLVELLPVGGLGLLLVSVRVVPDNLLRRRLELHRIVQAEMAGTAAGLPLTLGMAWAGAGVWALLAGGLVAWLVQAAVAFAFVPWRPGIRVRTPRAGEIMRFSLASFGSRICWATCTQADAVILGKLSGSTALGIYSIAKQFAMLPASKLTEVVNQVSYPLMARLQAEREAMRSLLLRGIRLVSALSFPLCAGLALIAADAVQVVLTEKWIAAVPVLRLLCLHAMVISVSTLLPPVLLAHYRTTFLLRYSLTLLAVLPPAFVVGAFWADVVGVASVWVVVYPLLMVWMVREAIREADVSWLDLWKQLRPAVTATAAMAGTVAVAGWVLASIDVDSALVRLTTLATLGALAYGGGLLTAGGPIVSELGEVLGRLFRRQAVGTSQ